jgi:uncharacterized membrane protein YhhN
MKYKSQIAFVLIFWLVVAADIVGIAMHISLLHYIAKPLLIPLLLGLPDASGSSGQVTGKKYIIAGLLFSWLGDVCLLFENRHQLFFILGLVCFLTTHILYIIYFLKIKSPAASLLKKQPLVALPVIAYGISLVWLLYPYLGELKMPVMVYATVICTMLICSMHVFLKVGPPANRYFLFGALLFVTSYSLLAINKFYQPFSYAGILIMLTYCAAQYFIVNGFIKQNTHDEDRTAG